MRIVFFGTPQLAVPSLVELNATHDVLAVVCRPDLPVGRSKKLVAPAVKAEAEGLGIEVEQPLKLNDGAFEAWLKEKAPDLCALVAYGRILKQPILEVPTHGFLNLHPSLLPKYRGPSPIQTAILEGETETGITIMRIDAGMDSGDILLQARIEILPNDTAGTLSQRVEKEGATLLCDGVGLVESGQATFSPQRHEEATHSKMFEKSDGRIHWGASAREIHNLVRAANPWPVAHCSFQERIIRIHETKIVEQEVDGAPGVVMRAENDQIVVATGEGGIALLRIQAPGKKAMSTGDYLRGNSVLPGAMFEDL